VKKAQKERVEDDGGASGGRVSRYARADVSYKVSVFTWQRTKLQRITSCVIDGQLSRTLHHGISTVRRTASFQRSLADSQPIATYARCHSVDKNVCVYTDLRIWHPRFARRKTPTRQESLVRQAKTLPNLPPCAANNPVGRSRPMRGSVRSNHLLLLRSHWPTSAHWVVRRAGREVRRASSITLVILLLRPAKAC
jgi:hypothetical protein